MAKLILLGFGSRSFDDVDVIRAVLTITRPRVVFHGDERYGADALLDNTARSMGIPRVRVPAAWLAGQPSGWAGPQRNKFQLKLAELLAEAEKWPLIGLGFRIPYDKKSNGTDGMAELCLGSVTRTQMAFTWCFTAQEWHAVLESGDLERRVTSILSA